MTEAEELVALVRSLTKDLPPELQQPVTETTVRLLVVILTDPRYLNQLRIIQQLRSAAEQPKVILVPVSRPPARQRAKKNKMVLPPTTRAPRTTSTNKAFRKGAAGK